MAKTTAKKKTTKKATAPRRTIDVRPTARQLAAAKACLARSGKIVIGFKEISVTKLPDKISPVMDFRD